MYVTLEALKKHLNVDFSDDDDYITSLGEAAESSIERYIQQPLTSVETSTGVIPTDLAHAIKIFAAQLYANREPVAFGVPQTVPFTLTFLLQPFVKYT